MYWTLFITFVKIGTFTIGGGYAMLPLIQREVVNKGWISEEDFIDLFSVAQSLPGIFAVNISIFLGYKLKKLPGCLVCALGTILPSFLIILTIALFFTQVADNEWVVKAFKGIRPVVVALIAVPVLTTARTLKLKGWVIVIPIVAALLIWLVGLSPIWIILAAIAGGMAYTFIIKEAISKK
ncbi:chromate transporter [Parabacteroides sp. PF5-6]|uniref:chromate transporter n=1 Tax=Parabacteroides sp. PF5-6 TaxID=1742403 RepID=UPI00240547A1|nr:chromate transporter [Parabacteroides sp. PF5-6]MDF9830612.1 chromate transporter [Parabacteroides sp. PF5-6]